MSKLPYEEVVRIFGQCERSLKFSPPKESIKTDLPSFTNQNQINLPRVTYENSVNKARLVLKEKLKYKKCPYKFSL